MFQKIDEIVSVEREQAVQLYSEITQFINHNDLTSVPQQHIKLLIGLARFHVMAKEPQPAEELMQVAQEICQKYKLCSELISVKSTIAVTHSLRGDHMKAIFLWEDLLTDLKPGDSMWHAIVNNLIIAYGFTKQFTKAIDYSYQLLAWLDKSGSKEHRMAALINLGNAYRPMKQTDKAMVNYKEALLLAEETNNIPYLSYVLSNMSLSLNDLHDYDNALEYALRALVIHLKYFSDAHIADSYNSIGSIHKNGGNRNEALLFLKQALRLYECGQDRSALSNCYLNIGQLYMDLDRNDDAYLYLIKGYELAQEFDNNPMLISSCRLLTAYYSKIKDHENALKYSEMLCELYKEITDEVTSTFISQQEADYLRHKIELQSESYRLKNVELKNSNRIIRKQSKDLKKVNTELHNNIEVLNKLISVISHDVRGPIANTAHALRMIKAGKFDTETTGELNDEIIQSMDSLTDLLTEILLWIESKGSTTALVNILRPIAVDPLIENIRRMYQSQIMQKNIQFEFVAADKYSYAQTEPNALNIVLRNIISNAIKFTPDNGSITVNIVETADEIMINVQDSGIGMSQTEIDHLLKNKIKSRQGTTQEFGMGIGLKLCIHYLKLIDADLNISSEQGKGSLFCIKLKRAPKH